ncbi:MAG: cobalamin biosynthesis protein [Dehalococcoidia bacterium]|nr:cobalamin biosynthesis protein [Dehalococcoidia bacterium]
MESITGLIIISAALLIDILLGEPPNRAHPVAWLGSFISLLLKTQPGKGKTRQALYGTAIVIFTLLVIVIPVCLIIIYLQYLNTVVYVIVSAYLLKHTFSLRGLWQAVQKVKTNLQSSSVQTAREDVKALVHRDPSQLDNSQLISAAIESCAENLCDSFVAPLFYFAIFGLPGAVAYRIANTFDAMIGYHGRWEYTGKFAARFDDLLNYIPARLSAIFILAAAAICRASTAAGWKAMLAYHNRTESPNAGWTMSAMAGSLNIVLEKEGHYRLGNGENELSVSAISSSQAIMLTAASIWGCIVILKEVMVASIG